MDNTPISSESLEPEQTNPLDDDLKSNFPVRRNEKRNSICHKRLNELCEFRKRALEAIKKALHPEWRPIMAGDNDALTRLRKKIEDQEKQQAIMKAVNAVIRKNAKQGQGAQIAAIMAADSMFTEARAAQLLAPDFMGRIGFPDYVFQNNGANLRRMRARLALLERDKAAPETTQDGNNGVRLEDCPSDNRVRLFFPGKPDSAIRTLLNADKPDCRRVLVLDEDVDLAKSIAARIAALGYSAEHETCPAKSIRYILDCIFHILLAPGVTTFEDYEDS